MAGLLRFVDGAKPGKKLILESKHISSDKKYEDKRVRKFLAEWNKGRPWLRYENDKMYCECCRENETTGAFCVGTTNFKLTAIKQHESSNVHKKFALKYLRPKTVEKSQAAECLMKLKKAEYDRLVIKFRTAHAIAKSHQSFRFYNTMCRLDKAKGLDIGSSYLNDKSASTFVQTIADVTQDNVREKILKSKYLSFTCDGSTDFTGEDMENVYVRVVVDGIVEDLFLYIGTANSAGSADIFRFLMETFDNLSLNVEEKVIGFCADGASNMQGTKTGLAALLKEKWPHIFITHCLAHRLELAFKDAIKKSAVYDKMTTLLLGIYYLYRKSPKQKKYLGRAFEALGMTVILPSRVGGTRWLPHLQRAISAFIKGFRAFMFQLETSSHDNPKAEGLAKLARDGHVIIFILQLKMIIGVLARLSLYLQRRELCIGDAYMRVKATKAELLQILESECEEVANILVSNEYQDQKLTFKGRKPEPIPSALIQALIKAIDTRFPHTGTSLVDATLVANFNTWPDPTEPTKDTSLEFGKENIQQIFEHFVSSDEEKIQTLLEEWRSLKLLIYQEFQSDLQNGTLLWTKVYRRFAHDGGFDNIFEVINIIRCLPPTSVNNETTFSAMKLIKSKRRGHMKSSTLNALMLIHLQSPSIETFDPHPCVQRWMMGTSSGRKRRLGYQRESKSAQLEQAVTEPEVQTVTEPIETEVQTETEDTEADTTDTQEVQGTMTSSHSESQQEQLLQNTQKGYSSESSDSDYESDGDNEMSEREVDNMLFFYTRD